MDDGLDNYTRYAILGFQNKCDEDIVLKRTKEQLEVQGMWEDSEEVLDGVKVTWKLMRKVWTSKIIEIGSNYAIEAIVVKECDLLSLVNNYFITLGYSLQGLLNCIG